MAPIKRNGKSLILKTLEIPFVNSYISTKQDLIFFSSTPKKYHPLKYHMLEVAAVAYILLDNPFYSKLFEPFFGSKQQMREVLAFAITLHDLGKLSKEHFQIRLTADSGRLMGSNGIYKNTTHHTIIGEAPYRNIFSKGAHFNKNLRDLLLIIKDPIIFHHGSPPSSQDMDSDNKLIPKEQEYAGALVGQFAKAILNNGLNEKIFDLDLDLVDLLKKQKWVLSGLVIISDWLASNPDNFPFESKNIDIPTYWARSKITAHVTLSKIPLLAGIPSTYNSYQDFLGSHYQNLTPLQNQCLNLTINKDPELFIIEDIMGAGKTEASFLLVNKIMQTKSRGVFFALPSKATSNSFYERVSDIFPKFYDNLNSSLVLMHGDRFLNDTFKNSLLTEHSLEKGSVHAQCLDFFKKGNQSMLADVGVGTIDQIFKAILGNKHQALRLFGLVGKTIVFDEIHSTDSYMKGLLLNVLSFLKLLNVDVILMSATLTKEDKENMIKAYTGNRKIIQNSSYPLLTQISNGKVSEIPVETRDISNKTFNFEYTASIKKVYQYINDSMDRNSNVCWIRNTITDAIIAYNNLKNIYKDTDIEITLFHSGFTKKDRKLIEEDIIYKFGKKSCAKTRRRKIVVATQVIEQSLDLDFTYMVTDLVNADYLLQRTGRNQRHIRGLNENLEDKEERSEIKILIFGPEYEETVDPKWYSKFFPLAGFIYKEAIPYNTISWLKNNGMKVSVPKDIRPFIEESVSIDFDTEIGRSGYSDKISGENVSYFSKSESISPKTPFVKSEDYLRSSRLMNRTVNLLLLEETINGEISYINNTFNFSFISINITKLKLKVEHKKTDFKLYISGYEVEIDNDTFPVILTKSDNSYLGKETESNKTIFYSSISGLEIT